MTCNTDALANYCLYFDFTIKWMILLMGQHTWYLKIPFTAKNTIKRSNHELTRHQRLNFWNFTECSDVYTSIMTRFFFSISGPPKKHCKNVRFLARFWYFYTRCLRPNYTQTQTSSVPPRMQKKNNIMLGQMWLNFQKLISCTFYTYLFRLILPQM